MENIDETPSSMMRHGIIATFAEFYSLNRRGDSARTGRCAPFAEFYSLHRRGDSARTGRCAPMSDPDDLSPAEVDDGARCRVKPS
jgi:hypothetical protein